MGYCCTDFMTNCKHSVSIGWLKDFILDNIRKSDGSVFTISDRWDNSYTPTYAELTGGTLIQQYVDGGTGRWSNNVDGIKIEGTYSDNSTVKGVDVVLYYTRTGEFEISTDKTTFSECGDSTVINYTCGFSKVTKRLNSDCDIIASTVYGSDTSLTPRYSSSESWLTVSGNELNASKNGSISSSTRNSIVTAKVTIKGEEYTSNSITITQNALTGSYETNGTKTIDSFTFVGTPSSHMVGCEGGNIKMESTVVVKERHYWIDSCNRKYETVYNDTFETITDTQTGSFDKKECPIEEYAEQKTLSYTYSGVTKAITFTQDCEQSCCQEIGYTPTSCNSPTIPVDKCGETNTIDFSVLQYCVGGQDAPIPYTDFVVTWEHVNGTDDFVTFTGDKKLTWNGKPNCNGQSKNAKYNRIVKTQDGSKTIQECMYTFTQTAERCENCECNCDVLSFDKAMDYYKTNKISSDGGTFTYTYEFDPCSGNKNIVVEKGDYSDTWYSINHNQTNSTIEVTVNSRTSADAGEAEIIVYLNSEECSRILFAQKAGCDCDDVQVLTNTIPQTGLTINSSIGTYSSSNGCASKLDLESNDLNITFGNGDIKILSEIPANTGYVPLTFTITKKVGVNNCGDIILTQPSEDVSCGCEDIDKFVSNYRKILPRDSQENYVIFTADTYGCGTISIEIDDGADMFENGIPTVIVEEGHKYTVSANINRAYNDRSGSGLITYMPNGADSGCTIPFCLLQTNSYIPEPTVDDFYDVPGCNKTLSGRDGITNEFGLSADWSSQYVTSITADADWIEFKRDESYGKWWYALNSSTNIARECVVTLHVSIPELDCNNETVYFEKSLQTTFRQSPAITDCNSLKNALASIDMGSSYTYDEERGLFILNENWTFDVNDYSSSYMLAQIPISNFLGGVLSISDEENFYISFDTSNLKYGASNYHYISKKNNDYIGDKKLYISLELCNGTKCQVCEINYAEVTSDACDCDLISFDGFDLKIYNNTINDKTIIFSRSTSCSSHTYSAYTCDINGEPVICDWLSIELSTGSTSFYDAYYYYMVNDAQNTVPQNADVYVKLIATDCGKEIISHAYRVDECFQGWNVEHHGIDYISSTNFGAVGDEVLIGKVRIIKKYVDGDKMYDSKCIGDENIKVVPQDTSTATVLQGRIEYHGIVTENGTEYYEYYAYIKFLQQSTGQPSVTVNFKGSVIWTTTFITQ